VGERRLVLGLDGCVTLGNAADVAMFASDLVVAGSAVFDGVAPGDNARALLDALGTAPASNDAGSLAGSGRLER
jgi:pentose-5-phosphate-3-epimerase